MLRHCNRLKGYRLGANDGEIGKVEDFYFDDQNWTVRYVVADTGYWLPDRLVLLSPHAFQSAEDEAKILHTRLSRQQIENSPPITADQPVSRQFEREYYSYYGWPVYWTGPALWGPGPYPLYYAPLAARHTPDRQAEVSGDPHLRSTNEITGYALEARDGAVGHIDDVILDEPSWVIRYLVIDTGNWLPGKKVLVAPQWIEQVSWERSAVRVDLARETIRQAPEYDVHSPIGRDYEISLFKHYSREGYWEGEPTVNRDAA